MSFQVLGNVIIIRNHKIHKSLCISVTIEFLCIKIFHTLACPCWDCPKRLVKPNIPDLKHKFNNAFKQWRFVVFFIYILFKGLASAGSTKAHVYTVLKPNHTKHPRNGKIFVVTLNHNVVSGRNRGCQLESMKQLYFKVFCLIKKHLMRIL